MILAGAALAVLAACTGERASDLAAPGVEQDINAARNSGPTSTADTSADLLRNPAPPAPLPPPAVPTVSPPATTVPETHAEPGPGNVGVGRRFAQNNCRPCHVVQANEGSAVRFANAPDFFAIAGMPSTTSFSLNVWLRNPHPTMPSLILSRQEAADVVAYILSLRGVH
jgi:mono/diheme cytochrome c family protein